MRSIDELATEICTLTGHINAANHRWLMLIAEFDRRQGCSDGATLPAGTSSMRGALVR